LSRWTAAVRPFARQKRREVSKPSETIHPSHVDFGQCARVANFRIVCVSKKVLSVSINYLRDGDFDRLVENVIPKHFRSWTSKLLANWLIELRVKILTSSFKVPNKECSPLWFRVRPHDYKVSFKRSITFCVGVDEISSIIKQYSKAGTMR
jgi:hypothetical protein